MKDSTTDSITIEYDENKKRVFIPDRTPYAPPPTLQDILEVAKTKFPNTPSSELWVFPGGYKRQSIIIMIMQKRA